ncbi:hypothetical protein DFH09DRAFT_1088055 [Mycena vulgaris]|nr:hypothetical protein DFH09DRAFT_1088055 [Mycena vulgaris]
MPTLIFSYFQLEKSTQTLMLHVGNHDRELPRIQHKQYTVCLEPAKTYGKQESVDLYDPLKRPSRPSFDGPLLEEKNGRRDGHGTRSTGAVEPSRRQRAAALLGMGDTRHSWPKLEADCWCFCLKGFNP